MADKSITSKFARYPVGKKDYVIPIVYPDYMVAMPTWARKYVGRLPFGHAAVLIINEENGVTKYFEYGRYDPKEFGIVQQRTIPNVEIKKRKVTPESLKKVLKKISQQSGQNGRIEATIHRGDYYEKAFKWMKEDDTKYRGKTIEEYSVPNHNCVTFAIDLLHHLKIETHWVGITAIPDEEMEELQEDFRDLSYNPKTDTLEIEENKND